MVFLVICAFMLAIWSLLGQRKVLSVSFANLLGTMLFVVLGLQFEPSLDNWVMILIGVMFYLFLVLGEYSARHIPVNAFRFKKLGQVLIFHPLANGALTICFIVFSLLPIVQVLSSGQSIGDAFAAVWTTNTAPATSRDLIEMSAQSLSGRAALINGIQTQLSGFWYLSLGILLISRRRLFFPVFGIYLIGSFLTSGGFRSLLMVSLLLPVLLLLMSNDKPRAKRDRASRHPQSMRLVTVLLIGVLVIGLLLLLDWLRYGRQGLVSEGTVLTRLERTLRTDFAYGGFGLRLGYNNMPESFDRGLNYIARTIMLPIPRVIWPEKPTSNPNQEYTEVVTGRSYSEFGSILLFTPLGEALYHFGLFGIALIPFLYGFLVSLLERIYISSPAYKGLLVQTYIWAFLAMRLTFFNLYSTLVITNFILIIILVVGSRLISNRDYIRPKTLPNAAN
jgi:hypothetical protein